MMAQAHNNLGELDGVPSTWIQSGPAPTVAAIWGMN